MLTRLYRERLLWMRMQRGWTQADAATACGGSVTETQYSSWERGKVISPKGPTYRRLAKAFECDVRDLKITPEMTPDPVIYAFYHGKKLQSGLIANMDANRRRLIAFDVDGVLLKQLTYSWELIWNFLGDDGTARREGVQLHDRGDFTYNQWCAYCSHHFRERGLMRTDFSEITKSVKVVQGFHKVVEHLKARGWIVGIISGSVDTFLDELMPDYDNIMDFTFINRLVFEKGGKIRAIDPTPFDFKGKAEGLLQVCAQYEVDPKNAVYVGDHFNDRDMYKVAGTTIAHQPKSQELVDLFDHTVVDDSLESILPFIRL